jgi:transcriptional regulator with XRE-family HTH domain
MATKRRRDLRAALALRGMTASDASRRMGVNPSTVSRLLSGETPWSERNARAFSFATGIPLTTILPNGQEATA